MDDTDGSTIAGVDNLVVLEDSTESTASESESDPEISSQVDPTDNPTTNPEIENFHGPPPLRTNFDVEPYTDFVPENPEIEKSVRFQLENEVFGDDVETLPELQPDEPESPTDGDIDSTNPTTIAQGIKDNPRVRKKPERYRQTYLTITKSTIEYAANMAHVLAEYIYQKAFVQTYSINKGIKKFRDKAIESLNKEVD